MSDEPDKNDSQPSFDDPFESADEDHARSIAIDPMFFKLFVEQIAGMKRRDQHMKIDQITVRDVLMGQSMRQDTLIERTPNAQRWFANLNVPVVCRSTHVGVMQQRWFYNLPQDMLAPLVIMIRRELGGKPWETHLTSFVDDLGFVSPHLCFFVDERD